MAYSDKYNLLESNKNGFILPFMIIIVVILTAMGFGLIKLGAIARTKATYNTERLSSIAVSDAGLTKAIYELNRNLDTVPWDFGNIASTATETLPVANTSYTYTIEEITEGSEYRITSTGTSAQVEKITSAIVTLEGTFASAIFSTSTTSSDDPMIQIDGYNINSYSSDPNITATGLFQIRANSVLQNTVALDGDIEINADIVVGPGVNPEYVIDMDDGVEVTGDMYAAPEVTELEASIVPEELENLDEENYEAGEIITGNVKYTSMTIPKDVTQTISGNCAIYVAGNLIIQSGAELVIPAGSSLTLYLGKKLDVQKKGAGIINESQNPEKVQIYGTDGCTLIKFDEVLDFYGTVYAPLASINITKSNDIYGSLIGQSVNLTKANGDSNKTFYYDESLGSIGTVRFVTESWNQQ